jgi:hypothetical protein
MLAFQIWWHRVLLSLRANLKYVNYDEYTLRTSDTRVSFYGSSPTRNYRYVEFRRCDTVKLSKTQSEICSSLNHNSNSNPERASILIISPTHVDSKHILPSHVVCSLNWPAGVHVYVKNCIFYFSFILCSSVQNTINTRVNIKLYSHCKREWLARAWWAKAPLLRYASPARSNTLYHNNKNT